MTTMTRRELVGLAAAGVTALSGPETAAQGRAGRHVSIEARPQAILIDTGSTAVIVVDMQNDFGSKGGMLDRMGIDISGIQKAVAPTLFDGPVNAAGQAEVVGGDDELFQFMSFLFHASSDMVRCGGAEERGVRRTLWYAARTNDEGNTADGRVSGCT